MKTIKNKLLLALLLILPAIMLGSCSKDEPQTFSILGTWYYGRLTANDNYDYTAVTLVRDGSFTQTRAVMTPGGEERIYNSLGQWTLGQNGTLLNMYFTDMSIDNYFIDNCPDNGNRMEMTLRAAPVVWNRSLSSLPRN